MLKINCAPFVRKNADRGGRKCQIREMRCTLILSSTQFSDSSLPSTIAVLLCLLIKLSNYSPVFSEAVDWF